MVYAQYPFESKSAIKYKEYSKWKIVKRSENETGYSIIIPGFFRDGASLGIKLAGDTRTERNRMFLFRNNKPIGSFLDSLSVGPPGMGNNPKAVYAEDINGDGLKDLKILIPFYGCCGAFNFYAQIIYLIQQPGGHFKIIAFTDWMDSEEMENRPERDFDGDHNFEIVTKTFQSYGKHNYELYNIYNFVDGKLVNVNAKGNYPLLIQLLWGPNYTGTNKVSKAKIKKLSKPLPDNFLQIPMQRD